MRRLFVCRWRRSAEIKRRPRHIHTDIHAHTHTFDRPRPRTHEMPGSCLEKFVRCRGRTRGTRLKRVGLRKWMGVGGGVQEIAREIQVCHQGGTKAWEGQGEMHERERERARESENERGRESERERDRERERERDARSTAAVWHRILRLSKGNVASCFSVALCCLCRTRSVEFTIVTMPTSTGRRSSKGPAGRSDCV